MRFLSIRNPRRCYCGMWTFDVTYADGTDDYAHWGTLGRFTETQRAQLREARAQAEAAEERAA